MKVITYSSAPSILGGCSKSRTFCTTFKYVFLDLDDRLAEIPPTLTLISPSRARDGSSNFPSLATSLPSDLV